MTLSAIRPVPDAQTPQQQRLEVELLLGEPVLDRSRLDQAEPEALTACPSIALDRWTALSALPLSVRGEELAVAVPTYWGEEEREGLQGAIESEGLRPVLSIALKTDIEAVLASRLSGNQPTSDLTGSTAEAFTSTPADSAETGATAQPAKNTFFPPAAEKPSLLDNLRIETPPEESAEEDDTFTSLEASIHATNASPVVSLVNRILLQALDSDSSDIHVEPEEQDLQVRFRQDGVLHPLERLPKSLTPAVTSRLKIMADLDIAERRMPQDGRIRRMYKGRPIEFRVSTLPGRWGEKVVLRLLDSGATRMGLDSLITDPDTLALVRGLGARPFGMILVTGPTGSGKTTTLYSLLSERNDPGINISTVEDPIEYMLEGITQTQVNRDKGYDFSTALRAFMRQDPDVLLVGETRDGETAKTAIEAALTGHLVLTTLHCNDAPSAIARLHEMGVESFMVSASLLGIVSQRLLRRVCPDCRMSYHPSGEELGHFGLFAADEGNITFYKARHGAGPDGEVCPTCQGRGYKGRVGVYEVLRINEQLGTAIAQGASTDVLRKLSIESGMKTLLGYGLELVRQGHSTLEEVERMLLTDTELESERRARALTTLSCKGCGAGLKDEWLECPYCLTSRS
jgi:type IV pilus assembly protein PilB